MTASLYKSSGEISEVKPQSGKQFTLEEMQGMVGGYIEVISTIKLGCTWMLLLLPLAWFVGLLFGASEAIILTNDK